MNKLVIWDFNGTIIDDTSFCLDIENKMLKARNMKNGYTLNDYRDLFCFPVIDYYYKLGYTFEKESYQEVSDEFNKEYDAIFSKIPLMPGFISKINESIKKGYNNIVLSATLQSTLKNECDILDISKYFIDLVGIDDNMAFSKITHAKNWFKDNNINPDDCYYIGDTLHDLETINALNIKKYTLVSCGHQSYDVLNALAKGHVVKCLDDIIL